MIFHLPLPRLNYVEPPRLLKVRQDLSKCLDKKPVAKGSPHHRSDYAKISKLIRPCTINVAQRQLSISTRMSSHDTNIQIKTRLRSQKSYRIFNVTQRPYDRGKDQVI